MHIASRNCTSQRSSKNLVFTEEKDHYRKIQLIKMQRTTMECLSISLATIIQFLHLKPRTVHRREHRKIVKARGPGHLLPVSLLEEMTQRLCVCVVMVLKKLGEVD